MGLMEMQLAEQVVRERADEAERYWARRRLLEARLAASRPHGEGFPVRRQLALLLGHLLRFRVRRMEAGPAEERAEGRFARVPEGV